MNNYDKYVKINNRCLNKAIKEGLRPMYEFFDPNRDGLPFFGNSMSNDETFGNSHDTSFSISHIPGRWLNAILNAKSVLGIEPDMKAIENLRKWTYRSLEEVNIRFPACINIDTMVVEKSTDLHNLREIMHALYSLITFQGETKAYNLAMDIISAVDQYFDYNNCVFREGAYIADTHAKIKRWFIPEENLPFPVTFGRYIGPLVKLYNTTGSQEALRQALLLKEACFKKILDPQGNFNPKIFGAHTHSTTSMISSLAQLGDAVNDLDILIRVKNFLENGLRMIALDFGWCIENYYRKDMVGEINNTSDIMETCLILGKHGFEGCYSRAEQILRGHFLPSQLIDTGFIPEYLDGPEEKRALASRSKGAFGFPCPFGHEDHPGSNISFNWDIVGGGVGGLCEAYRHKVTRKGDLLSINLLFDHEDKYLSFKSPYGRNCVASFTLKVPGMARIRIPNNCTIDLGKVIGCSSYINGEWLYLTETELKREVLLPFNMKQDDKEYLFRDKLLGLRWEGEEVIGATSAGKRLCFFKELNLPQNI